MYISFNNQFNLIFLFAIPIVIFLHFFGIRNIRGKALKFANFDAIARIKGIDLYSKNIFLLIFDIVFVILLVFSISGLTLHKEMGASTFSYVIAIDSSQSMSANDVPPNRFSVAKETAMDFVDSSPYDSPMAVISFAGNSVLEQEMTNEKSLLKSAISDIEFSAVGGTDIYEVVYNSIDLLKKEKSKAIVLLSDGQVNTDNIYEAIGLAKDEEIVVHTIAVGTVSGGEASFGISKVDEDSLKGVAYNAGGEFFSVESKVEMEQAFGTIIQETKRLAAIDLSFYLIVLVMGIFVVRQFFVSINKILW